MKTSPEIMRSAGVYEICIKRGAKPPQFYIGQATILRKRRTVHLRALAAGKHGNSRLQRAYNKYGPESLSFRPLLVCERKKETLDMYEKAILDSYQRDAIFNMCLECVGSKLGVKMSDATKRKIGAANKGAFRSQSHRDAVRLSNQTRIVSAETRKKMAIARTGNKNCLGRKLTDEHKANVGAGLKGMKKTKEELERRGATRRKNAESRGYY